MSPGGIVLFLSNPSALLRQEFNKNCSVPDNGVMRGRKQKSQSFGLAQIQNL